MRLEEELIGAIEDIVKSPKLVASGVNELRRLSKNSPSFDPEKRKFLKHAAVLAGLIAGGKLLEADARGAYLLSQDLIRGPSLLIHPETGLPSDFNHHVLRPINQGWGAVDHEVPIGTPIVPTADVYGKIDVASSTGSIDLYLVHVFGYRSLYAHLSEYAKIIKDSVSLDKLDRNTFLKLLQETPKFGKLMIVAFSGNTGRGPGPSGYQPPHLHFAVRKRTNGFPQPPGLDPFALGIDLKKPVGEYGGRPVYWDGKTEIDFSIRRTRLLEESLDTLAARLKESDLDGGTINDLLKRHNNPIELRDYLGTSVLMKKPGPNGKPKYEFMPGSLMYALMLEFYNRTSRHDFIAMLPFIFPDDRVKVHYQKANPGVQF